MNAKRIGIGTLLFVLSLGILSAQEQPEIAYRILNGYVDKREADGGGGKKIGGTIMVAVGGLMLAGAGTVWFAGDAIAESAGHSGGMNPDTKFGVTLGVGIGGLALTGAGAGVLFSKPHDYRKEYAEVFTEADHQVREALSVAVLRDMSIKARKSRITGAVSSLMVPLVYSAIKIGANLTNNRPWQEKVMDGFYWSAWSIAGGLSNLFGSTEEERLYEKYLAGRDALYGDRDAGN